MSEGMFYVLDDAPETSEDFFYVSGAPQMSDRLNLPIRYADNINDKWVALSFAPTRWSSAPIANAGCWWRRCSTRSR